MADVRPQTSVPHLLADLALLCTSRLDNEVNGQAIRCLSAARPASMT